MSSQVCQSCSASYFGGYFSVSSGKEKTLWTDEKMYNRICIYAQRKNKPCLNPCNTYNPSLQFGQGKKPSI